MELTVSVSGAPTESRLLTLPVDVYAPDGTVVASGTASPARPAFFVWPPREDEVGRVHVLGRLPNGAILQQTVELCAGRGEARLHLGDQSPHEWLQWVTPFRSLVHLGADSGSTISASRRIGKVWMTLWALHEGRWESQGAQLASRERDSGMQQIVLDVSRSPHLLQIGGEEIAWRLISLPPGGQVRIALTRNPSPEGDALEVTVGRAQPENELIMSYLARGAFSDADRLAETWDAADLLLQRKKEDPISAVAGAYLLLKNHRLQERHRWVDNLVEWFPYLADGAIVAAALALQRSTVREAQVRSMLALALKRGLPVFAMGATVLVETMAAIHRGKRETKSFHAAYLAAQAYARARCSRGAYLAFFGKSPAEPSWTPIYGPEGDPAAGPISSGRVERVVHSRPIGSIRAGKFGDTRVELPRAPVSAELFNELRAPERLTNRELLQEPSVGTRQPKDNSPLFRQINDLGIPAIETHFLEAFSVDSRRVLQSKVQRPSSAALKEHAIERQPVAVKRPPRQTPSYWRTERLKNAMPVFDGEE